MENESSERWNSRKDIAKIDAYTQGLSVVFSQHVWEKIYGWCRAADTEISGMGLVKKEGGVFKVYDIFLPEQECTGSSTEMNQDALAALITKLHKTKIPADHFRCWMHTHYNFNVFWSGTDVDTIEQLIGSSGDWMLSIVVNQAGDYKCRLDFTKPIRMAIDDIDVSIEYPKTGLTEQYKQDVEKMVKRPTYTAPAYTGYSGYEGFQHLGNGREWEGWGDNPQKEIGFNKPVLHKKLTKKQKRELKKLALKFREKEKSRDSVLAGYGRDYRQARWCDKIKDWIFDKKGSENGSITIEPDSTPQEEKNRQERSFHTKSCVKSAADAEMCWAEGIQLSVKEAKELGYEVTE